MVERSQMSPRSNTMAWARKIKICVESDIEKEKIKEILATTLTTEKIFDKILSKFLLLETLRLLNWISRFLSNSAIMFMIFFLIVEHIFCRKFPFHHK